MLGLFLWLGYSCGPKSISFAAKPLRSLFMKKHHSHESGNLPNLQQWFNKSAVFKLSGFIKRYRPSPV
jgi:hypothetical protein